MKITKVEAELLVDSIQERGLDAIDLACIFDDPDAWLAESESRAARVIRAMRDGMVQPELCCECSETYDEARGDGYCGLCPACADKEDVDAPR